MTDARTFLKSLNDCEFSFVYVYKYNTYMDHGKQLLETERLQRQLNYWQVSDYVSNTEFQLSNTGCVRCNSPKPLIKRKCVVCDHVFTPNRLIRAEKNEEIMIEPGPPTPWYIRIPLFIFQMIIEMLLSG